MRRRARSWLVLLSGAACALLPAGVSPAHAQQVEEAAHQYSDQQLADQRRIGAAFARLQPQRKGTVDAYVIVIALDSDPVFGREAREAGRVLAGRFDAAGRTLVLAGDEGEAKADAPGSPQTLTLALSRVAEIMDRSEDVLVLYSTSHGLPGEGLVYKDDQRGVGLISPVGLAEMLTPLGFRNRLLILQACFSGQFVPALRSPGTVVLTAAAEDRPSFGCQPGNDWTLFGAALVNHALRQPMSLSAQFRRASALIAAAEERAGLLPSNPQISIGSATSSWLSALDARAPKVASSPVGEPVPGLGL